MAAAATLDLLKTITVGVGGASTVSFTSIPQGYTDLYIKASTRSSSGGYGLLGAVRFNNDANNNYFDVNLYTSAYTSTGAGIHSGISFGYIICSSGPSHNSNVFSCNDIYIPNYKNNEYKSYSNDGSSGGNTVDAYGSMVGGLWKNTSPITDITFYPGGGYNFTENSTFYLYGIKNS